MGNGLPRSIVIREFHNDLHEAYEWELAMGSLDNDAIVEAAAGIGVLIDKTCCWGCGKGGGRGGRLPRSRRGLKDMACVHGLLVFFFTAGSEVQIVVIGGAAAVSNFLRSVRDE